MLDDALDVVLVILVDGGLPLDVVDDEGGGVLQDLFVFMSEDHVGLTGQTCARAVTTLLTNAALFCALLLPLWKGTKGLVTSYLHDTYTTFAASDLI